LSASECFRKGFGDVFVDYFVALKRAEIKRAEADETIARRRTTSPRGHREYFDLA